MDRNAMRRGCVRGASFACLLVMTPATWAHHGRDFLLIQSAHIPEAGTGYLISRQDYINRDGGYEYEFEPGLVIGTTDWLTLELHPHVANEEQEPSRHELTGGVMYVRFTPRDSALSVGASAEYADSADHDVNDEWAGALLVTYAESGWIAALNVDVSHEMNPGAGDDSGIHAGVRRNLNERIAFQTTNARLLRSSRCGCTSISVSFTNSDS